jgi:O-antigen biosynthesis protein
LSRIIKVVRLVKRIKRRHLKLGAAGILTVSKNHLIDIFLPKVPEIFVSRPPLKTDWVYKKTSLSILLTVFNQSREQLEVSINSARAQKGAEIKIIILDDGSSREETVNFLNHFIPNANESLIRQENSGVVSARNRLINDVTTDFLVFLDPDDEFESDYVSMAFSILDADRGVEIIYPNVLVYDVAQNSHTVWGTGPFNIDTLTLVNTIPMSSIISTRLIRTLGGYSPDFETGPEDWDLWVRAALSNAKAEHLPEVGYKYTKAEVSRSSSLELNMSEYQEKILLRSAGFKAGLPLSISKEVQIFLLIPWLTKIGGVEKYVRCVLEDLKLAGLRTAVICTEPDQKSYEDDSIDLRNQGNIVIKRSNFLSDKLFIKALTRLAAPNCISINFGAPWDFQNSKMTEKVFSKQVCFIFNSDDSMRRAVEHHKKFDEFWVAFEGIKKVLPKRIAPRSNTVFTGVIDGQMTLKESPNRSTFNVGFLGRFSPEKRPELFVEIAKNASQYKDLKFVMAGEGPMLTKVLEKTDDLTNFEYLGVVANISDFFSQIDCLVISSETEGISLSAMEALSHGIPVLSTDVGGMRELLVDENQGYIWSGKPKDALPLLVQLVEKKKLGKAEISLPPKFWRKNTSAGVVARINELLA